MIGIIDYGLGNIRSVMNAVSFCSDQPCRVIDRPEDLPEFSKLILPGVGAFGKAMENLCSQGLDQAIIKAVTGGTPLLGICLGMQLLATRSQEFGLTQGLDLIPGEIRIFDSREGGLRIPHMGWNNVDAVHGEPLFKDIPNRSDFYFAHSYCLMPEEPEDVIATTGYSGTFASAVGRHHVYGVQFHPEKSQGAGLQLIRNFIELEVPC